MFPPVFTNALVPIHWFTATFLLFVSTGCVAIGVPSQRYHDPDDHGGLLGDWRQHNLGSVGGTHPLPPEERCGLACDSDWQPPLELDENGGSIADSKGDTPEVPWPRFHPVPTRPVYGPSQGINATAGVAPLP